MSDTYINAAESTNLSSHNTQWGSSIPLTQGNINVAKIGNGIILTFPPVITTSTSTDIITMETNFPPNLRPVTSILIPIPVVVNGQNVIGGVTLLDTGILEVRASLLAGSPNFNNGEVNGFNPWTVAYVGSGNF